MGSDVTVTGKVVRLESDDAWIELPRQLGCARCETGQGCGAGTLVKLFSRKAIQIKIALDGKEAQGETAQVGDAVTLALPAKTLNRSAVRAYLYPLLGLLLGALLGQWLAQWFALEAIGEGGAILGGLLGMVIVLLSNRKKLTPASYTIYSDERISTTFSSSL